MFRDNVKQDVQDKDNVLCLEAMGLWELFFVCVYHSEFSEFSQHYRPNHDTALCSPVSHLLQCLMFRNFDQNLVKEFVLSSGVSLGLD